MAAAKLSHSVIAFDEVVCDPVNNPNGMKMLTIFTYNRGLNAKPFFTQIIADMHWRPPGPMGKLKPKSWPYSTWTDYNSRTISEALNTHDRVVAFVKGLEEDTDEWKLFLVMRKLERSC